MAQSSDSDPRGKVQVFQRAWDILSIEDRTHYWDFAVGELQNIRAPKGPPRAELSSYDALCAAVHELDGRAQNKTGILGLPRTTKRLSGDELQKAIRRLKDRLIGNEYAQSFLIQVLSRWVQLAKLPALLGCLDALGCSHDEVGNRVGALPIVDEQIAIASITPVANKLGFYDVMVVCAALSANHHGWEPVWAVTQALKQGIPERQEPQLKEGGPVSQQQLTPTSLPDTRIELSSRPPQPDAPLMHPISAPLEAARITLEQLGESLRAALGDVENGLVPRPEQLVIDLQHLDQWIENANVSLGMKTREFAAIQTVLQLEDSKFHNRLALQRLTCVRHASDSNYDAHEPAMRDVHRALGLLERGQFEEAQSLIHPLLSLLALIEHAEDIDDEAAARHDDAIRRTYGARLAISAHRGSLRIYSNDAPQNGSEKHAAPAHEEINLTNLNTQRTRASSMGAIAGETLTGVQVALPATCDPSELGGTFEQGNPPPRTTPGDLSEAAHRLAAALEASPSIGSTMHQTLTPSLALAGPATQHPVEVIKIPSNEILKPPEPIEGAKAFAILNLTPEMQASKPASRAAPQTASPPATPTAVRVAAQPKLPFAQSLSDFKALAWINTRGCVDVAPWTSNGFEEKLHDAAIRAWAQGRFGLSYLFSVAMAGQGKALKAVCLDDLAQANRLLENPADLAVQRDSQRTLRVRDLLVQSGKAQESSAAISLVLEALAPSHPVTWSADEARTLCRNVGIEYSQLETAIVFLLTGWSSAGDPLGMIRAHLKDAKPDPQMLEANLAAAQANLQRLIATLWNAAGGRIVHTHCKKAWMSFIREQVAPLRDALAPQGNQKRLPELSSSQAFLKITDMGRAFQTIMNDGGVRHGDRSAAQAAAEQIVTAIEKVVDIKTQRDAAGRRQVGSMVVPRSDIEKLVRELPSDPLQRLCVLMLRAAWTEQSQINPLRVPAAYLRIFPDLVRAMSPDAVSADSIHEGIPIYSFSDVLLATVLLLESKDEPIAFAARAELLELLRDTGIDNDRADLLAALVPSGCLQSHEKTQLHRRALEIGNAAYQSIELLQGIWTACDDLLAPRAKIFRKFIDEAQEASSFSAGEAPISETLLVKAWLERGILEANSELESVITVRSEEANRHPRHIGEQFANLIAAKDYRGAMALFHSDQPSIDLEEPEPVRVTMWRSAAVHKFPNPRTTLLNELKGATSEQSSLVSWWVSPSENDITYRDTRSGSVRLNSFSRKISGHTAG